VICQLDVVYNWPSKQSQKLLDIKFLFFSLGMCTIIQTPQNGIVSIYGFRIKVDPMNSKAPWKATLTPKILSDHIWVNCHFM
jgi:hypothetical protein